MKNGIKATDLQIGKSYYLRNAHASAEFTGAYAEYNPIKQEREMLYHFSEWGVNQSYTAAEIEKHVFASYADAYPENAG